jgi:hypothetical protein
MGVFFRRLAVFAAAVGCISLASCGSGPSNSTKSATGATLEGTVKYGTEEVRAAQIIVVGKDGTSAVGSIEADGRYLVKDAPIGEVTIAVNTAAGKGMMMGAAMASRDGKPPTPPAKLIDVPTKWAEPATSTIKTTVNKGKNEFNIEIPK